MKFRFSTSSTARALLAATLLLALSTATRAEMISGAITFDGSVTLNTKTVNTATKVVSWVNASVEYADGDFSAFTSHNAPVSIVAPWSFNTTSPVANFWQVGGFHFDLLSSHIVFQNFGALVVEGSGTMYGNGFTPTPGSWSFTTQNPSARSRFSFSAALDVAEGGTSVALLGTSLLLLALGRKQLRRRVNAVSGELTSPCAAGAQSLGDN